VIRLIIYCSCILFLYIFFYQLILSYLIVCVGRTRRTTRGRSYYIILYLSPKNYQKTWCRHSKDHYIQWFGFYTILRSVLLWRYTFSFFKYEPIIFTVHFEKSDVFSKILSKLLCIIIKTWFTKI